MYIYIYYVDENMTKLPENWQHVRVFTIESSAKGSGCDIFIEVPK